MPLTKKMVTTDVWTLAQERVNTLYDRFDRVAVSFSGGKDSTAALHVVLEVARARGKLPVEAYFWDEEAIHPETVDYVRRVSQRPDVNLRWLCLPIQHRNACSKREPYWYCWAPEDEAKWCRPLPPEAITDLPGFFRRPVPECNIHVFPNRNETVAVVMGIRAAESLRRYRSVANKTVDNWLAQDSGAPDARSRGIPPEWAKAPHVTLAKPIYDWRTEDVWTAPLKFGWDYNRCTPAETPIWMGDFSFKRISEVKAGDEVIGWGRLPERRDALVRTKVRAARQIGTEPLVRVTLSSGRVLRCTPDHIWQLKMPGTNGNYYYGPAEPGAELAHIADVSTPVASRAAGWLAGIYDGEACGDRVYQSPTHNPHVYAAIAEALRGMGVPFTPLNGGSAAQHGFRITNGRAGLLHFINTVDPVRRVSPHVDDVILGGRFRTPDRVVTVEPDGVEPVYALTTDTGNYVAWGYASKNSYDVMAKAGITRHDQRVCPPYGEEPLRGLWQYAQCWPELWEKMIGRVPGAATAGRYCRSPMYAFGDVSKPPDLSWQEAITKELGKWPEEYRVKIAERIKAEIRWHNKNTNNAPIPDDSEKGMCWSFLYMVAVRGDFKGRKGVNYDEAAEDHGAVGSRGSLDTRFDGS